MAPVIRALEQSGWAEVILISTGQQDDLLNQALRDFALVPDYSIPHDQDAFNVLRVLTSVANKLDLLLGQIKPGCVIAQGDTTTAFASSLASFYRQIPFVHVEAGLRTHDLESPFPEEFHRQAIAISAALHCAPTEVAAANLRREGVTDDRILVSGNTVIDAVLEIAADGPGLPPDFPSAFRPILLTAHRRENFGEPLRDAFLAIRKFVDCAPDTAVFFPVHPNPAARSIAYEVLSDHPRIRLVEPASCRDIVAAMQRAWLVVTDSGGLQEEAPALGKPVLVLREVTERPEAVEAGVVRVVGTSQDSVFRALTELHQDEIAYRRMARRIFPYGDGRAAERIVACLRDRVLGTRMIAGPSGFARMKQAGDRTWMT
jgi:UDP-N-acetylglucosamine 2-epimerase (non-hydrolysing)